MTTPVAPRRKVWPEAGAVVVAAFASLQMAGIQHTFLETPGAHHWRVWRGYLRDVAPLLFR